jgi:hypothetical protein
MRDINVLARPLEREVRTLASGLGLQSPSVSVVISERTLTVTLFAWADELDSQPIEVASGSMTFLPGNAHVVCVHGARVGSRFRRRGIGTGMHLARIRAAQAVGCRSAMCTVRSDNEVQHRILRRAGWQCVGSATGTAVCWMRSLEGSAVLSPVPPSEEASR